MTNPTEVERLVERLRAQVFNDLSGKLARHPVCIEAAALIEAQAAEIARKDAALEGAIVALDECANIMRPKLPSLADNVIALVATKARAALAAPEGEG